MEAVGKKIIGFHFSCFFSCCHYVLSITEIRINLCFLFYFVFFNSSYANWLFIVSRLKDTGEEGIIKKIWCEIKMIWYTICTYVHIYMQFVKWYSYISMKEINDHLHDKFKETFSFILLWVCFFNLCILKPIKVRKGKLLRYPYTRMRQLIVFFQVDV